MSDSDLFGQWCRGDSGAFESLMRMHFGSVWTVALAITGDADMAEDVCQDAFVRCWERRDQCRQPERFRAWLLSMARSVALNHLAHAKSRKTVPLLPDVVARGDATDLASDLAELRGVLLDGMSRLGEVQRTVLMLRDVEGWSHHEVADQLGISETMSRRHLSDARKAMRAYLQHADLHD